MCFPRSQNDRHDAAPIIIGLEDDVAREEVTWTRWKACIWNTIRSLDKKKQFWNKIPWIRASAPVFEQFPGMDMRNQSEVSVSFLVLFCFCSFHLV